MYSKLIVLAASPLAAVIAKNNLLSWAMQAATPDAAATAAVCHVPDCTPDPCTPHQQGSACLAVIPSPAAVHCRPLHQFPRLCMVSLMCICCQHALFAVMTLCCSNALFARLLVAVMFFPTQCSIAWMDSLAMHQPCSAMACCSYSEAPCCIMAAFWLHAWILGQL